MLRTAAQWIGFWLLWSVVSFAGLLVDRILFRGTVVAPSIITFMEGWIGTEGVQLRVFEVVTSGLLGLIDGLLLGLFQWSNLIDNDIPGLIIDLRVNGGGNGGLALDFVDYVFDEEILISQRLYFNDITEQFEVRGNPARIEPGPIVYDGPIALLVSPDCASACEGFAHAISQGGRAIVVGHYPSAGMYGEVGRGQYDLPGGISLQFPTGRPETLDGKLLIEGVGIVPDITVPVTAESALGQIDTVLQAAIDALLSQIGG